MDNDIFLELDTMSLNVEIEKENIGCLYTALVEAKENVCNYAMMMSGIIIRLGKISDKLSELATAYAKERNGKTLSG